MEECSVCCDGFTKRDRKRVACGHCGYEACRKCVGTYLLQRLDAACMSCGAVWSVGFLQENFTKTWFLDVWIPHRARLLFDREKALLPETQETRIPGYRRCEAIKRELAIVGAEEERLVRELLAARVRETALRNERYALQRTGFLGGDGSFDRAGGAKRAYFACPSTEGCRGLVDSSWKCGVCAAPVCKDCREPLLGGDGGDAHVCDADRVSTFALLGKDTKPCPNCHVPVTKTGGCDQMWCVACDSAFSWATGRAIVNQAIHNPYYFEYLARLGAEGRADAYGNVLDDAADRCDGDFGMSLGHASAVARGMARMGAACSLAVVVRARTVCSTVQHVFHVSRARHLAIVRDASGDRWPTRVSFLLGKIGEDEFRRGIEADEKKRLRSAEYVQILETYLMAVAPDVRAMLVKYAGGATGDVAAAEHLDRAERVAAFCDDAIAALNRAWNCSLARVGW